MEVGLTRSSVRSRKRSAWRQKGLDIIDIGAESTRPGHEPVSAATEIARLLPVLEALQGEIECPISVDTMKAPVAEAALKRARRSSMMCGVSHAILVSPH